MEISAKDLENYITVIRREAPKPTEEEIKPLKFSQLKSRIFAEMRKNPVEWALVAATVAILSIGAIRGRSNFEAGPVRVSAASDVDKNSEATHPSGYSDSIRELEEKYGPGHVVDLGWVKGRVIAREGVNVRDYPSMEGKIVDVYPHYKYEDNPNKRLSQLISKPDGLWVIWPELDENGVQSSRFSAFSVDGEQMIELTPDGHDADSSPVVFTPRIQVDIASR